MARYRSKQQKKDREDPLTNPVKPPADPELAALRNTTITPILSKLRDANPCLRAEAAREVESIRKNEKYRKLLLREKIVYIILRETLDDLSLESQAAGWSILKYLVEEENIDFCIHLYRLKAIQAVDRASSVVCFDLEAP